MSALHAMQAGALVLCAVGCAHGRALDVRLSELTAATRQARAQGAYRCAPEELARAEAELEFARAELAVGDRARADEHLVRAGANARAALRVSADPSCGSSPRVVPEARDRELFPAAKAVRLSMTHPPLRRGSTKDYAAI